MYELYNSDSEEMIFWKINHNFRAEVVSPEMNADEFRQQVEASLKIPVRRFCDQKVNPQLGVVAEPSSLVSDDGERIELFCTGKCFESVDGVNWSKGVNLVTSNGVFPGHHSVHKIDGMYLMTGVSRDNHYIDLYTSDDKVHFEYRGHMVSPHEGIGNGERFDNLGNTYILKNDQGKYFLYYEGATHKSNWEICLATCDDLLSPQDNGFVGNWVNCSENPILPYTEKDFVGEVTHVYCNPEIAKGEDNQPLVINGRYYMYYLSYFYKGNIYYTTLNRAYSEDLIHWTEEGVIFDNRDLPDGGEARGDNGDQCLTQFKGKTYLFYTHNINSKGYSKYNIRYTVDNRSFDELLRIKP